MTTILSAALFAAKAHSDQRRKDVKKTPYINHPLSVSHAIEAVGVTDVEVLCVALLHDTVEDCGVQVEELAKLFGPRVAEMVQECSDDKKLGKAERKKLQIVHAGHASPGAKLVKLADKLDNCRGLLTDAPADWSVERVQGYLVWAKRVVEAVVAGGLPSDAHRQLVDQLQRIVFSAEFSKDGGKKHPCIPADPKREEEVLQEYYKQLETVKD
jgi:guanosine-3',5'-bis(diphosphate) 3'-pyrophosphohydrolase